MGGLRRGLGHMARACAVVGAVAAVVGEGAAQQPRTDTTVYRFDTIIVTATRSPKPVFTTPAPVSVIDSVALQRARPNTVADLFRSQPGLDVTGVGVQQPRPIIRGQRGQRILLLQDGVRLNNARRQQDFGEVPALVDVASVERVEIVRGPASVLYGTDAIGGVVNIITRSPPAAGWRGHASYRFGGAQEQHKGALSLSGRSGALDFLVGGTLRDAGSYTAPAGSFGEITLDRDVTVHGTGVRDRSGQAQLGYELAEGQHLFVRAEAYRSEGAGFGFVDPADYAPSQPRIDIHYPEQRFAKLTGGWSATFRGTVADGLDVTAYAQDNERNLNFDLFQSFGPQAPPGAGIDIETFNYTDLETVGLRVEARKLAARRLLLTYGVDAFRDASENTDSSVTRIVGFGPPQTMVSTRPQVPNATFRSLGAFAQGELTVGPRLTVILGGRVQEIHAETRATPGITERFESKTNRTVAGAANVLVRATETLSLIGSVGRAFRSPNLIEWFFEGPTPEGNGYQVRTPDLEPETSLSVDVGARFRSGRLYAEGFLFRNEVSDGIRIEPLGTDVDGLPAFRNVNVEKLVFRGVELNGEVALLPALAVNGTYTWIESEDALDPSNPIGDSFSTRITGGLRYEHPSDRFWAEYFARHNGERKEVSLQDNPVGDVLPSFTVHGLRGGLTVFRRGGHTHRIGVAVENLTDELYAESSNVSFFRPEPARNVTLSYQVSF